MVALDLRFHLYNFRHPAKGLLCKKLGLVSRYPVASVTEKYNLVPVKAGR